MLIRGIVILIVLGIAAGFYGFQEYSVSVGTTTEPLEVALEDLEAGKKVKNNHLNIGFHWAVMESCIYWYELESYESEDDIDDNTKVTSVYYPIISDSHPYIQATIDVIDQYDGWENVPDDQWPPLEEFSILVKSKKYKTVGAIPLDFLDVESVQGLVVNRIKKLDSTERRLLKESFPTMNLDRVIILEEGRKPQSPVFSFFLLGLGGLLIIAALVLVVKVVKEGQDKKFSEQDG